MKAVGVDPAPGKKSTVVTGGPPAESKSAQELSTSLNRYRDEHESLLLCWDSPLTGPALPDGNKFIGSDHTQRPIEKFFMREAGLKAPSGISVLSYGGCPHWTISQRLLGLPRTGPHMKAWTDLPFTLLTDDESLSEPGHYVAEVHPAVALWLWCRPEKESRSTSGWKYKDDDEVRAELWEILARRLSDIGLLNGSILPLPSNDDEVDAFVSWALGALWAEGHKEVVSVGNRKTGSFLLPSQKDLNLQATFEDFIAEELGSADTYLE
jgi:hypothetical protein